MHSNYVLNSIGVSNVIYADISDNLITAIENNHWNFFGNGGVLDNLKNAHNGIECINSDHQYWFTPYTI